MSQAYTHIADAAPSSIGITWLNREKECVRERRLYTEFHAELCLHKIFCIMFTLKYIVKKQGRSSE